MITCFYRIIYNTVFRDVSLFHELCGLCPTIFRRYFVYFQHLFAPILDFLSKHFLYFNNFLQNWPMTLNYRSRRKFASMKFIEKWHVAKTVLYLLVPHKWWMIILIIHLVRFMNHCLTIPDWWQCDLIFIYLNYWPLFSVDLIFYVNCKILYFRLRTWLENTNQA